CWVNPVNWVLNGALLSATVPFSGPGWTMTPVTLGSGPGASDAHKNGGAISSPSSSVRPPRHTCVNRTGVPGCAAWHTVVTQYGPRTRATNSPEVFSVARCH